MKPTKRYPGGRFCGDSVARQRLLSEAVSAVDKVATDTRALTAARCIDIALEMSPLTAKAIAREFGLEYLLDEPEGRR